MKTKRRRPLLAALLSFCLPGLGQAYNTEWRRGILVFLSIVVILFVFTFIWIFVPPSVPMMILVLLFIVAIFGLYFFAIIDSLRRARRNESAALTRYNRWWVYVLLIAIYHLAFAPLSPLLRSRRIWATYAIPSGSMVPTLQPGDYVVAWGNYYQTHMPARGDVVIYRRPSDTRTEFVKRVLGLPGDHVKLVSNRLSINGRPVVREAPARLPDLNTLKLPSGATVIQEVLPGGRSYFVLRLVDDGPLANFPELVIPEDRYLVLGDNRDNSLDSRSEGFIPRANIHDRVMFVFWSRDWRRIGSAVE